MQVLVQQLIGASQLPARSGQYQNIIHVTQIHEAPVAGFAAHGSKGIIEWGQVNRCDQRAKRTAPGNATPNILKDPATIDAAFDVLAQQIHQKPVSDFFG